VLRAQIALVEQQMRGELAKARATFAHNVNRGDGGEASLRAVLRQYLPRRYELGHGEVVDSFGGRSAQTDIVVANEDHPFIFTADLPGLFLVEGVSAAGEVKSVLTKQNLEDSLPKSVRFKSLKPAHVRSLAFTGEKDRNKFGENPPWFIFAYESRLSLEGITEILDGFQKSLPAATRMADAVFCLERGSVVDVGDGLSDLKAVGADGSQLAGWIRNASSEVLFDFLGWLSISVPRVVRMASILPVYLMPRGERV